MCVSSAACRHARAHFDVAVGLVALRGETSEIRDAAAAAMDSPSELTIRPLLNLGGGRPWLPHVNSALAEAGIVGSREILGGQNG